MIGWLRRQLGSGDLPNEECEPFRYHDGIGHRSIDPGHALRELDRLCRPVGGYFSVMRQLACAPHPELGEAVRLDHFRKLLGTASVLTSAVCEVFAVFPLTGDEPRPGGLTWKQQLELANSFLGFFVTKVQASNPTAFQEP